MIHRRRFISLAATYAATLFAVHPETASAQAVMGNPEGQARIGILKVKEWPAGGEAVSFAGDSVIKGTGAPGLDAAAILLGSNVFVRRKLQAAAASVGFSASAVLDSSVPKLLADRGFNAVLSDDAAFTNAVRNSTALNWPKDVDAILDVQVNSAGYYPARRAGGYSPMVYAVARLISTTNGKELLRFGYDSDYRDSEGERRFITTPKEISVAEPQDIMTKARATLNKSTATDPSSLIGT